MEDCERFAPNDPNQNPVEDVWLQAKKLESIGISVEISK